jgi:hypothetical protein
MTLGPAARDAVIYEAEALLTRLDRIQPFAMQTPMVVAAALSPEAQIEIERFLARGRRELRSAARSFVRWAREGDPTPRELQQRFVTLRLIFNRAFNHFDMFADALSQRAQHNFGIWIGGLDALAQDALRTPRRHYDAPPVVTYLDRGLGAAIRRARTRLPGGGSNPVSIIRLPRERMVGSGIGSSLVHEVGHQVAALLGLIPSLRAALHDRQRAEPGEAPLWGLWERWISELVADFWSVAKLGIGSTIGLMQVVALPRAFVFRIHPTDPHPAPWIRVKASCAMGNALFPHPQWAALGRLWESYYPPGPDVPTVVRALDARAPAFAALLAAHRPASLGGLSLRGALQPEDRVPARLQALYRRWSGDAGVIAAAPPTLAMAVLGQAKFDGELSPIVEGELHSKLLQAWALAGAVSVASRPAPAALALSTASPILKETGHGYREAA